MKRLFPFLIVAILSLFVGLFFGIALGARLGLRMALTKQSNHLLLMHTDLTASPPKLPAVRDGLLLEVQGFQAELSDGSFVSFLRPDYIFAAFVPAASERQQYQASEAYLSTHGVSPLPR